MFWPGTFVSRGNGQNKQYGVQLTDIFATGIGKNKKTLPISPKQLDSTS